MGTHPIFESDFDCLTEMSKHSKRVPRFPTGMHSSIPAEIGRAEDGVKEAFEKSKEKISKNAKDFQTQVKQRTKGAKKSVRKSLSKGIKKVKGFKNGIWDGTLLKFSELPEWMQDNEFITALHRPELNNALTCLKSIFTIHAETGNIWTHMIGAVLFLGFILKYLFLSSENFVSPFEERYIVISFFLCAFICLTFSTMYHTFGCHSPNLCLFCGRLDYTGISVLITGSFIPWVYYSFYCSGLTRSVYMGLVTTFGVTCSLISMAKSFALPKYRTYRAVLFMIFGGVGLFPLIHFTYENGIAHSFDEGQMHWLITMLLLYVIGTMFFITRFPECVWPGKFNLVFQSHQIFHVFVVLAALVQTYAIYNLRIIRLELGNSCES